MRRRWKVTLIAGACVAVVGTAAALARPAIATATAPRSLGSVTWTDAVIASRSATVLTVAADVEHLDDRGGCGFLVEPHVVETARRVAIRLQVFVRPLPADVACAGSAVIALPATITLTKALGDRSLVDTADASPHPVLVVDRTPTLTAIAAPYRRRTTSWDESTGSVGEWWRWQTRGQSSQIDLEFGPPATLRRYDTPPSGAHHATVGNAPAVVWTERTGDLLTSTVTWTDSPGRDFRLTLLDESTNPLSESALVELADSLREAGGPTWWRGRFTGTRRTIPGKVRGGCASRAALAIGEISPSLSVTRSVTLGR